MYIFSTGLIIHGECEFFYIKFLTLVTINILGVCNHRMSSVLVHSRNICFFVHLMHIYMQQSVTLYQCDLFFKLNLVSYQKTPLLVPLYIFMFSNEFKNSSLRNKIILKRIS